MNHQRPVYMVLSPRSLDYAGLAIRTLLHQSQDDLHLHLITDSAADRGTLERELEFLQPASRHRCEVFSEDDLRDSEADRFRHLPNLRTFRHGHPCWRKITDPLLLTEPGVEMILLDPDLYFPNRFRFEQTPETGLLLMWQQPNCLLPDTVVRRAMELGIPLARHVDIGVAHWRPSGADLEWLDWLLGKLGGAELPRKMHVEAIVWSAIAMHGGGGYLDPQLWRCWHRTQGKRLRLKLGTSGASILGAEPWNQIKCFHGGGEAKWWLPAIADAHAAPSELVLPQPQTLPFVQLTPKRYGFEQAAKSAVGRLGYYKLFGGQA